METMTDRGGSDPLVSVVVPVLRDRPGIRACLGALLDQTYPPDRYEIIVADNGSTDGTRAVVEDLRARAGSRLLLVVEDRIRTSYAARNRGLSVARGEILAFTDADCVPAPTWLESGVRALRAEGAAIVGGRIVVTYRGARPNVYEYWDSAIRFNQQAYVNRHYAATANMMVYAHLIERHGPFRAELVTGGDREFGHRLWRAGERVAYAPDALVSHAARATLGAVYRKSLRIALGHQSLHELGVAPRRECMFKPLRSWRCPVPRDWTGRLPFPAMVTVRLLHVLNAWLVLTVCSGRALRSWARSGRLGRQERRPGALADAAGRPVPTLGRLPGQGVSGGAE